MSSAAVRGRSAVGLVRIDPSRAVMPLATALQNDDGARISIAFALGQTRDRRAVGPLLAAFDDEKEKYTRETIAYALRNIGAAEAMQKLSSSGP